MIHEFSDDMDEISGMGGDYEEACRLMVVAGVDWMERHEDADPKFYEYEGVTGIIGENNEDATELVEHMLHALPDNGDNATGAMVHVTVAHVIWISKNGWDAYVWYSRGRKDGRK
jgi:hypothetical protein